MRNLLILIVGLVIFVGCEESTVQPFEDSIGEFTVYGAIHVDSTINFIRVKDVQSGLLSDTSSFDDMTVTFENLDTGVSQVLKDSIVFFNTNPTRNFVLEEALTPRTSYQLTVEGSDGSVSTSIATTPGQTTLTMTPEEPESCFDDILIEFDNVLDPEFVRFDLGVWRGESFIWGEIKSVRQLNRVDGTNKVATVLSIRNMLVDLFPPVAEATVNVPPEFWNPTTTCRQLANGNMKIRYIHFGPEWDVVRSARLDIDYFESGDVDNGFGLFGAIDTGEISFFTTGVPNNN